VPATALVTDCLVHGRCDGTGDIAVAMRRRAAARMVAQRGGTMIAGDDKTMRSKVLMATPAPT